MVLLYSTHCPKCQVLELKLKQKNINFSIIDNIDTILEISESHNISSAPILQVDEEFYDFSAAINYLKELK